MRTHHTLHIALYSAGKDCQIASLNEILKEESYHIARYLSADQFVTTVFFLLKAVISS